MIDLWPCTVKKFVQIAGSSSLLKRLYRQQQPENAGPSDGMSNLKLYNYSNQQIVHLSGADLACSKFRQAMTWDERHAAHIYILFFTQFRLSL